MGRFFRRLWKYFGASANTRLDERADPKIQIEQAIEDAQRQHQQLTQQAAAVLGNRRQLEMKLARQIDQVERLQASARQSLVLLDQANAKGDTAAAASYEQAAQSFATQLVAAEAAMEDLKTLHDSALQSSEAAKKAVEQNAFNLRQKLAERSKLLTQLEHAKMQEQMNRSLASISELSVPGDTPTLGEVREKIEQRYANALGQSELASTSVEAKMLEVQKATIDIQAASRLDEIRSSMGGPPRPSLDKARSGVADGPPPSLPAAGDETRSKPSAAAAPAAAPSGVES